MDENIQPGAYDGMYDPGMLPSNTQEDIWFRSETFRALEKILEDKLADEKLKDFPLWSVASKSMKLTFLTENDKIAFENLFEAEICKYLRSLPPGDQNLDTAQNIGQARNIFMSNIRRSYGTETNKMNERIAIISQMKIQSAEGFNGGNKKGGILSRLFGFGGK